MTHPTHRPLLFTSTVAVTALIFISACSSPTPAPITPTILTPISVPTVNAPAVPTSVAAELPTLLPTVTPGIAPIVSPTSSLPSPVPPTPIPATVTPAPGGAVTRAPTSTTVPAASSDTPTPFPEGVPHVYITSLRVEPAAPKADPGPTFLATFQNSTDKDDGYDWCVEIWDVDNARRPFGLTSCQNTSMPVGVTNSGAGGWTVKGLGECHAYRGRAVARDQDDNRGAFLQPNGQELWVDFTVCP